MNTAKDQYSTKIT